MFVQKLFNKLLGCSYFKPKLTESANSVKRSWKRRALRTLLRVFPRKVVASRSIKNEQQETRTKFSQWLEKLQSFWAIGVAVITILGALTLLIFLHQEQAVPVFMYIFDQPLFLIAIALLSFASILALAVFLNIHVFYLYEYLNNKPRIFITYISISMISFSPFIFYYFISFEFYEWLIVALVFTLLPVGHLRARYGVPMLYAFPMAVSSYLAILIIYYSVPTIFDEKLIKEDWHGYLATALIYPYFIFISFAFFDREKRFNFLIVMLIIVMALFNKQVWNLASTYSGVKSQNTCYYLDDKTNYESETLFRFGKVLVPCNCTLETFDEKIDTCLIIKDGKVQEQFTRVLPIK